MGAQQHLAAHVVDGLARVVQPEEQLHGGLALADAAHARAPRQLQAAAPAAAPAAAARAAVAVLRGRQSPRQRAVWGSWLEVSCEHQTSSSSVTEGESHSHVSGAPTMAAESHAMGSAPRCAAHTARTLFQEPCLAPSAPRIRCAGTHGAQTLHGAAHLFRGEAHDGIAQGVRAQRQAAHAPATLPHPPECAVHLYGNRACTCIMNR